MKAAVMRAVGEPLTIEDVDIAEPGPFEVRIRVAAAGLCHTDLRFMEGSYPLPLPAVLGHESAGIVEAVGERVTDVSPGDHVVTSLSVFCGSCYQCSRGYQYMCENKKATQRSSEETPRLSVGGGPAHQFLDLASFAEHMLVHDNAVVKVTEEIPLDRAALLGCGVATGLGAVFNTAGVRPGEDVAVIGCGGVGLAAVQGARIAGANRIIAVDRVVEKLELAEKMGATHTVNGSEVEDPVREVRAITGKAGVNHALEAIGTARTAEIAFGMLRWGGTATIVGLIPTGQMVSIPGDVLFWEKKLQRSVMGSNRFKTDTPRYVQMYLDGRLNLDDMVSGRIPLEDVNEGFARMETGQDARNVIVFDL
jgi:S-(hydroxymethyl)glutathione dehydrogenase/alcohol dehydrogenase